MSNPLTKVEHQVGELPAAREVRPVATHRAIFGIRVGATRQCGFLPSPDPVAMVPLELDVDLQRVCGERAGRRLRGKAQVLR